MNESVVTVIPNLPDQKKTFEKPGTALILAEFIRNRGPLKAIHISRSVGLHPKAVNRTIKSLYNGGEGLLKYVKPGGWYAIKEDFEKGVKSYLFECAADFLRKLEMLDSALGVWDSFKTV